MGSIWFVVEDVDEVVPNLDEIDMSGDTSIGLFLPVPHRYFTGNGCSIVDDEELFNEFMTFTFLLCSFDSKRGHLAGEIAFLGNINIDFEQWLGASFAYFKEDTRASLFKPGNIRIQARELFPSEHIKFIPMVHEIIIKVLMFKPFRYYHSFI